MAEWNVPHRFSIDKIEFDVTFHHIFVQLSKNQKRNWYEVTLAFAHKVGYPTDTVAAKAIKNPNDDYNCIYAQRLAFKRLMQTVFINWSKDYIETEYDHPCKEFVNKARNFAYLAGMWNTEE